jgi:hypothetical protein
MTATKQTRKNHPFDIGTENKLGLSKQQLLSSGHKTRPQSQYNTKLDRLK